MGEKVNKGAGVEPQASMRRLNALCNSDLSVPIFPLNLNFRPYFTVSAVVLLVTHYQSGIFRDYLHQLSYIHFSPFLELKTKLSSSKVLDKCVYINLAQSIGHVFVSHFPNGVEKLTFYNASACTVINLHARCIQPSVSHRAPFTTSLCTILPDCNNLICN